MGPNGSPPDGGLIAGAVVGTFVGVDVGTEVGALVGRLVEGTHVLPYSFRTNP